MAPQSPPRFFVGIGAQKAGTTWLHDYLENHPQVAASPLKELHYFDAKYRPGMCGQWDRKWQESLAELASQYAEEADVKGPGEQAPDTNLLKRIRCVALRLEMIKRPECYRQYFAALIDDTTRAFGETTPAYSLLPAEGFQEILGHYPGAKFIFIARDPVQRFLSQVRFNCKQRNIRPKQGQSEDDLVLSFLHNPHFSRRSDYRETLTNLYRVVPQEQVLVVFFEHLFNSRTNEDEMRKLCRFLQLDYQPARLSDRMNPTRNVQYSPMVIGKVRAASEHVYDYMRVRFGSDVPSAWME